VKPMFYDLDSGRSVPLDETWWSVRYHWRAQDSNIAFALDGFVTREDAAAFAALQTSLIRIRGRGFYLLTQLGHRLLVPESHLQTDFLAPQPADGEVLTFALVEARPRPSALDPSRTEGIDPYVCEVIRWWRWGHPTSRDRLRTELLEHFRDERKDRSRAAGRALDVYERRGRKVDILLDQLLAERWLEEAPCVDTRGRAALYPTLQMLGATAEVVLGDRREEFRRWRDRCFGCNPGAPYLDRDDADYMRSFAWGLQPYAERNMEPCGERDERTARWAEHHILAQTGARSLGDRPERILHLAPTLYVPWEELRDVSDLELSVHSPELGEITPEGLLFTRPYRNRNLVVAGTASHRIGWYARLGSTGESVTLYCVWRSRIKKLVVRHQINATLVDTREGSHLYSTITYCAPTRGMRSEVPQAFVETPYPGATMAEFVLSRRCRAQIGRYELKYTATGEQVTEIRERVFLVSQPTHTASFVVDDREFDGTHFHGQPKTLPQVTHPQVTDTTAETEATHG
jgi:hypothetical protein